MEECKNKLDSYAIPKKFLTYKPSEFSYKLYINLCHYAFWNYFMDNNKKDRVEHYILDYGYKTLSDYFKTIGYNISRSKIKKQIEGNKIYRIKGNDKLTETNLNWNSPTANYSIVKLSSIKKLLNEEEMSIRFYVLLQGWKYEEIKGITKEQILSMIGYSSNSKSILDKFTDCIKRLKELELVDYKKYSNGKGQTYLIYYKMNV